MQPWADGSTLDDSIYGLFWGLFSALTYALYIILPIKIDSKMGSILVIGVGMTISGFLAVPLRAPCWDGIPTCIF